MNSSSDAAESMVRMTLEGTQVALRVTGSAAKNVGAILLAISKDKTKTRGKTTLNNMLKSGKELKVFALKEEDLKKFVKEAKKYGVLYSVLVDKKQSKKDGLVDIIVRAEDAAKINRIFERFKFSSFDRATVQNETEKNKAREENIKSKEEVVDDILTKKEYKEETAKEETNPTGKETEKNSPSDSSWKHIKEGIKKRRRPSVRRALKNIKKQIEQKKLADENVKEALGTTPYKEAVKKIKSNTRTK